MRTMMLAAAALGLLTTGYAQDTETTAKLSGSALVDKWVRAKWDEAGLKPVKRSDDAEFMRRVYLDVVGVIPSLEEAEKFLAEKSMSKRQQLVEKLVKDERYGQHWGDIWSGILVGFDSDQRDQQARAEETQDLKAIFNKNVPYDEFARQVITVDGAVYDRYNPNMKSEENKDLPKEVSLAAYISRQSRVAGRDFPLAMAGKVTRVFMGVQIQCAQCHDHPFDKWTQEEFYGMASFFTGLVARQQTYTPPEAKNEKDPNAKRRMEIRYYTVHDRDDNAKKPETPREKMQAMRGGGGMDLRIPDSKGGPVKASFLETGKGVETGTSRRTTFAKYITDPSNLQFAKMTVNRYWAQFLGAGIVNPPDDFNGRNKPSHPELLTELAQDFIAHRYDLHWLIKTITSSEAYNLTSRAGKERDPQAEKYLALSRVRPLSPEQIMRSLMEAVDFGEGAIGKRLGLGRPARPGMAAGGDDMKERVFQQMVRQFRYSFGDDEGGEVAEFSGTIPSALLMMNGQVTGSGTTASFRGSSFSELLAKHSSPQDKVRAIFLKALSRAPSTGEMSRWTGHASKAGGEKGYEDCMWTLLNTSEFLFNH
ncbi:MAG TPA: DUF1549 domain-containing protein [Planctomycetota bacterium]|nr:DUF1549 domain-containing protein [Planctomycetota bacterium]